MTRWIAVLAGAAAVVASGAAGSERVTVTTSIGPTRLVSSTFGYSVVYRTVTHGASAQTEIHLYLFDHHWRDATPSLGRNINTIEDVSFVDPRHGWVAAYDCANVSVYVYRTSDGGGRLRCDRAAYRGDSQSLREDHAADARVLEARLAEARERRRARRQPDHGRLGHEAAARSENFA